MNEMHKENYTCPCCGYRTFDDLPGSYEICHVCFWEDDQVQILDPWFPGGANEPCLAEAQKNFEKVGACDEHCKKNVKGVLIGDKKDPMWRPVIDSDRAYIRAPKDLTRQELNDKNEWYYWLKNRV